MRRTPLCAPTSFRHCPTISADSVNIRLTKLNESGAESYEVQNLNENENGQLLKVTVEYSSAANGVFFGSDSASLSASAIVRREKLE